MYILFTEINVNKSHILESKGAIFSTFTNSNLMSKSSFEKRRMNKWLQKKRFLKTFKQPVISYLYHIWSIIMGVKLAYRLFAVLIIWKPLLLRWPNILIYAFLSLNIGMIWIDCCCLPSQYWHSEAQKILYFIRCNTIATYKISSIWIGTLYLYHWGTIK